MRTAVIGIGSNSLRMLVADINDGRLSRVKRYREGLRTFAALDADGNIAADMIRQAGESVGRFLVQAKSAGAETVHLFATSAVRDAKNQQSFIDAMERAASLKMEICSGDLEARLSYIGAADNDPAALIDIGGGSTEIACGQKGQIAYAVSLQMGAVRYYRAQPITDIASAQKVVALASRTLDAVKEKQLISAYPDWVGVGGTFTTTAALVQRIPWDDRSRIHDFPLTVEAVEDTMAYLAPMPLEKRLKLPSLQPQRADIVVHGIAILLACMRELHIPSIRVSECGNLEGYLKYKYL